MVYAQGMLEYGAILAAVAGNTLTGLLNFDPSWNVILIVGGIIFFFGWSSSNCDLPCINKYRYYLGIGGKK